MPRNRQGLTRNIPSTIQKTVREACGFGCVVCGAVPYEYDHLSTEFHKAHEHDADDIVLLCDSHHRMKTAGIISATDIARAKRSRAGVNSTLRFSLPATNRDFFIKWGSNEVSAKTNSIFVDEESILNFETTENDLEPIILSGQFRDRFGNIICHIQNNEIISSVDSIGDFTLMSNRFSYKLPRGMMGLEFTLSSAGIHITDAFHVCRDAYVRVSGDVLQIGNLERGMAFQRSKILDNARAVQVISTTKQFAFDHIDFSKLPVMQFVEFHARGNAVGVSIGGSKPYQPSFRWGDTRW